MEKQYRLAFMTSPVLISRRISLRLALAVGIMLACLPCSSVLAQSTVPYTWKDVQILGGGFVTGVIYSPTEQNLIYARTDVGGAYRWNPTNSTWIPLTDFLSADEENFSGIVSLATDPSDPNRVYMATGLYTQSWAGTGAVFASTNKGDSWTRYNLPIKLGGNEDGRSTGERLQVDPNLNSTLYMGSSTDGLWKSADYGATWSKVGSFPVATTPIGSGGISFVLFDKSSSTTGTATQTIYVGVLQNGTTLYKSTNAGATWEAVAGQPALMPHHAELGANGTLYLAYSNGPGPNGVSSGAIWKYNTGNGQWTTINPPSGQGGYAGISLDRQHPGTLVVSTMNRWYPKDEVFRSTDDGATWKPLLATATYDHSQAPYAASSTPHWLGDVEIDPFDGNKAWFVTGYGVYGTTNLTVADANTPTSWSFLNKGLEETVPTGLVSPPWGAPLVSILGDLDGFRHDNLDVSPPAGRHSPRYGTNVSIDFAENVPGFMARTHYNATAKYGAYSTDGGTSWTPFSNAPTGTNGPGTLALSADGSRIVWSPGGVATAYSTDKGTTWTTSTGLPNGVTPISDRVNPLKFYGYNGATGRVFVSTDGGATFTLGATGLPTVPDYLLYSANIKAVFGVEGDVWLTHPNGFYHSTNSGASFTKIANFQSAIRIAYGKAAAGKTYPAVYTVGRLNNVYGFYRSDDAGTTWARINDDQHEYFSVRSFTADPRTYGRVYVGTSGRGIIYGDAVAPITALSVVASANPTQIVMTETTTLSATVSGGTAPYSYTFSGPGTISPSGNTASVSSLTAGVQTFTIVASDATTPSSQTISTTVSVTVTQANTAPVATATINQTATVGTPFSYTINAFTDAETPNSLTYAASGLPSGLSLTGTTISGTPSATGVSTVTITATDPGSLSASTQLTITVGPAPVVGPLPFAITGVTTISCATVTAGERFVTFTPQYSGLNGQPVTFSIPNEMVGTTNAGPYTLRLYTDNPVVILKATQGANQNNYAYNWLTACNAGSGPPPINQAPVVAAPIPNQVATAGQVYSYNIPVNTFSDPNGDALTLSASGLPSGLSLTGTTISGTPSATGVSTVIITATDPGSLSVSTPFTISVSPASVTSTSPFAITSVTTISCTTVTVGERFVTFTPQYSGLNGQPVTFSVQNEMAPTTSAGPYILRLYTDNPVVTLKAIQGGSSNSFAYNWLAACNAGNPGGRRSAERMAPLSVSVLGNPVATETVDIDIRGTFGEPIRLRVLDNRGRLVSSQSIEQPKAVERATLGLSQSAGTYLLQVTTPTQQQVIKIVKQ